MAPTSTWLTLADFAYLYGISLLHCGRALQQYGWRDEFGQPTLGALEAGAVKNPGHYSSSHIPLWNADLCKPRFEKTGYELIS